MMSPCPALKRCGDALGVFAGRTKIILGNLKIPIDVIPTVRYILLILFDERPLSRSDPSADRARAGRTGAPRNGRQADGQVERWEAQRLALGAPGSPCRARWAHHPPPRVLRKHPGASHRSIPSRGFARDWQTSDALRRENIEAWLFEI